MADNHCIDCGKILSHPINTRCVKCTAKYKWLTKRDVMLHGAKSESRRDALGKASKERWGDPNFKARVSGLAKEQITKQWDDSTSKLVLNRKKSSLEIEFMRYLDAAGVSYTYQYRPSGCKRYYDFFLQQYNTLVEIDGIRWHYSDWAKQNGRPEKDRERDQWAYDHGFIMVRIPENALNPSIVTNWLLPELSNLRSQND